MRSNLLYIKTGVQVETDIFLSLLPNLRSISLILDRRSNLSGTDKAENASFKIGNVRNKLPAVYRRDLGSLPEQITSCKRLRMSPFRFHAT